MIAKVLHELLALFFTLVRIEIGSNVLLDIVMKHDWLTELDVDAAIVDPQQFCSFDDSQQ